MTPPPPTASLVPPLVSLSAGTDEDSLFETTAEIATLESEAFLRIIDCQTEEEFIIPRRVADTIRNHSVSMSTLERAEGQQNEERRVFSDIEKSFPELSWHPGFYYSLVSEGAVTSGDNVSLGEPILLWRPIFKVTRGPNESRWALCLNGYASHPLSSVPWNDLQGIAQLIESMKDPEYLRTQFALAYRQQAKDLIEDLRRRKLSTDLEERLAHTPLPKISAIQIAKKARTEPDICSLLQAKKKSMIRTITIDIEKKPYPIALMVKINSDYSNADIKSLENNLLASTGWVALDRTKTARVISGSSDIKKSHKWEIGFWITPPELVPLLEEYFDGLSLSVSVAKTKGWF